MVRMNQTIEQTLEQRGSRYGEFSEVAKLTETLYQTIMQTYFAAHGGPQSPALPPYLITATHMICNKLARAFCGDPLYDDNFRDISGYAELVVRELNKGTSNGN